MEPDKNPPVNIGILAHVDGGKTTLTEQILYLSGSVRSLGRVDDGGAHTDFMDVEKSKGHIGKSGVCLPNVEGTENKPHRHFPGHSDFSGKFSVY